MDIGRIERVSLRDVWPHEAYDFTQWLSENLEVLSDTIGLELTNAETEQPVGDFRVDILAESPGERIVAIENQLTRSDHDHLGKLITYLAMMEASAAVWIVSDPRPEHVSAVAWLNELSSVEFYLVKAEAIRIGDSDPAPLLTLIVGPSEAGEQVGDTKRQLAATERILVDFWSGLLDKAKGRTDLHSSVSPSKGQWISTGVGVSGVGLNYVIKRRGARVELYIARGKGHEAENKSIFDQLHSNRHEIEEAFGAALDWQRLENRAASRICFDVADLGYQDEDAWNEIQGAMIDAMIRLEAALRPHIKALRV